MHPVVNHPEIGEFEYEGYPVKLSRTPAFVHGRGPLLREHNRYVYGELLGLRRRGDEVAGKRQSDLRRLRWR